MAAPLIYIYMAEIRKCAFDGPKQSGSAKASLARYAYLQNTERVG